MGVTPFHTPAPPLARTFRSCIFTLWLLPGHDRIQRHIRGDPSLHLWEREVKKRRRGQAGSEETAKKESRVIEGNRSTAKPTHEHRDA